MRIHPRTHHYVLFFVWLLFQGLLLITHGVHTDLEATKYIDQANNLLAQGKFSAPKYFFYSTLILIIAFFTKIGAGYWAVAVFQTLLNGIATYALFKLGLHLTKSLRAAFIATFLFILFYPLQSWNAFLFTESVFISCCILFVYMIVLYPPSTLKNLGIGSGFLALLIVTRPSGVLLIIPFFVYALIISQKSFRQSLALLAVVGTTAFFLLINYALKGGEDMNAMTPFREEHTICFIPAEHPSRVDLRESGNPVADIIYYTINNPLHLGKLMIRRLASFYYLPKPYFSTLHNLYLLCIIIPVYVLCIIALYKKCIHHSISKFFLLLFLVYSLGIAFTCNDYHNRFIMPLFGFIFLYAGAGVDFSLAWLKKQRSS